MNISYFKNVSEKDTPLHRLDGRVKTVLFLAGIIIVTILSHWYMAAIIWLASILLFIPLRLPASRLIARLTLPFGIAWLVFLSIIFTNGSHPLLVIINSPIHLVVYSEGLRLGFLIMLRIMASVTLASVLSFSTPMIEILETLRLCKIPGIMIDIADMMYRYIFIIDETARSMHRAQMSRTCRRVSWLKQIQNTGNVAGYVMIKSFDRSVKIYNAMLSRGYSDGETAVAYFPKPISAIDFRYGLILLAFPIAVLIINFLI